MHTTHILWWPFGLGQKCAQKLSLQSPITKPAIMPYNILIFVRRIPGLSPSKFKDHYESHVRLLQHFSGDLFPKLHKRYYLNFSEDNHDSHPTVLQGDKASFDFDAVAEVSFDNEAAYHAFIDVLSTEEATEKLTADEDSFSVREKLKIVVIGDIQETKV